MAHQCVSSDAGGQCATTNIVLTLGMKNHPGFKCPVEQVQSWFDVLSAPNIDMVDVARAFFVIKQELLAKQRTMWQRVKGPIGAIIATLVRYGWNPISPFKWFGGGIPWIYQIGADPAQLLEVFRVDVDKHVWEQAARGRNGRGLENGGDVTIIRREIGRMQKFGRHREAGLLRLIAAGGIWTQARKYEAKLVTSPLCPYCESEPEDDYHFFWGCPCLNQLNLPEVLRTRGPRWCPPCDSPDFLPCYHLRGIVPKEWSHAPLLPHNELAPDYDEMVQHHGYEPGDFVDHEVPVFLDGSGGKFTADPRLRRCGWG